MKKRILRYLKHISLTFLVLIAVGFTILVREGGSVHYGDDPRRLVLDGEGPYVFFKGDSILNVRYLRGNKEDGFYTDVKEYPTKEPVKASCYFPLDSSNFSFEIHPDIIPPPANYQDDQPILAISDIESGYKTFRDFLIRSQVIDRDLNWTFGRGHLVLVGDFVDRGFSTTQVLWFIYKLEQAAQREGGKVHYILGNHELKNLQGKYESASPKYYGVAAILGKQPQELYGPDAFIGRWMSSKNTLERINGVLFVHGGIHPEVAALPHDLGAINQLVREQYYRAYFPKAQSSGEELLTSTRTGLAWYRGYFRADPEQEQIDAILNKFEARAIVVGHTLQSRVNASFAGKVIGIDVKHPKDYQSNLPAGRSEALLIEGGQFYRVLHTGERVAL
ncbi:metallophosphoesterase [Flavilitoribacter nigricans]|uniref:Calcineurin-like phosphoesterase domain-containing protein n=1 Tax=Flavilitoribacter nigricans (strain ATCC 23147 / DSM 23189 / NBRC 102662 / NCIMB 1420 / SS-2) TaxID=1122177 RepID=A0A2D0NJ33_FLAN2|nr:metallophosphoesterase [Flavilitoribacter nigricans]PHN08366.1 hypothetical protein CRP01_00190 [Flavilitoribacter nigricans DSM 23189 = NBRC 102662]